MRTTGPFPIARLVGAAALVWSAASYALAEAPAKEPFEGRVKMNVSQGQAKQTIDYFVKGERMRIETEAGPAGGQVMIVNMQKREVLMIMPAQRMYMAMPVPNLDAGSDGSGRPEPQEETKEILGYEARKYIFREGSSEYEIWATEELGKLGGLRLPTDRPGAGGSADSALARADFFPLRITERRGDEIATQVEVLEVDKKKLEETMFEPPADFRRMEAPLPMPPR